MYNGWGSKGIRHCTCVWETTLPGTGNHTHFSTLLLTATSRAGTCEGAGTSGGGTSPNCESGWGSMQWKIDKIKSKVLSKRFTNYEKRGQLDRKSIDHWYKMLHNC